MSQALLDKSTENRAVAIWAEQQGYYHAAVSRNYYALYQRLLSILYSDTDYESENEGCNHYDTISLFLKSIKGKLTREEKMDLAIMNALRRKRTEYEYYEEKITSKPQYDRVFNNDFIKVKTIMDKLITPMN